MDHILRFVIAIGSFCIAGSAIMTVACGITETTRYLKLAAYLFVIGAVILSTSQLIY